MRTARRGTILWLPGWSMAPAVFDQLRSELPDYHHALLDYSNAKAPDDMLALTEAAAAKWRANSTENSPLIIGGWSLGGLLALRLAAKGLTDGLILFAATARFIRPKDEAELGQPDAYVRQMMRALTTDAAVVETKFRQRLWTNDEQRAGKCDKLPPIGGWAVPALLAGLHILRNEEVKSVLSKIACPVLLIHGVEDEICPYQAAKELADGLPQAQLLSIPGCGHVPFLGREKEIAEEVRRWWNEQQHGG
ncbi:alpha/beta hydrolase [Paenibacillus aceris]|uniref:Pimeloyl-[acyl-carrier protein] methyl ester esterase n=1 Tax=Paenibacillus aceris TaxID=869555 RepID=A0ABS4HUR0_9BACL|nr:alpha/beta fold hydrolase [Paenibacillus aceris]MBP1962369.1 pimeloyl-[acyl-carrier protein] methyl ester esterase [Paenibacillus aceris]NHW37185.1 alpha/beta fold hydrolase [Paenibacillus aceris]